MIFTLKIVIVLLTMNPSPLAQSSFQVLLFGYHGGLSFPNSESWKKLLLQSCLIKRWTNKWINMYWNLPWE